MLWVDAQGRHPLLQQLAQRLALPARAVDNPLSDHDLILIGDEHGLGLLGAGGALPVRVDFSSGSAHWRRIHGGGEQLVRAARGRTREPLTVLDATAGLGTDSFVLASHGFEVTAAERHPVVAALLLDGLVRAAEDSALASILERLQVIEGDAMSLCASSVQPFDVIYLDPMFPVREKSAAVNKAMRAFHQLVGLDPEVDALLPQALSYARKRVVVKRPLRAPPLAGRAPSHQLSGKSIRFDVYAC